MMNSPLVSLNESEKSIVYLTNSLGEETGKGNIPIQVYKWYCKSCDDVMWRRFDDVWLRYLVSYGGLFGMLAIVEIEHSEADHWNNPEDYSEDWQKASSREVFEHISKVAEIIDERVPGYVMVGNETGIFGRHEVGIFFSAGTDKKEIEKAFGSISDLDFYY